MAEETKKETADPVAAQQAKADEANAKAAEEQKKAEIAAKEQAADQATDQTADAQKQQADALAEHDLPEPPKIQYSVNEDTGTITEHVGSKP
jgi:hypothetical protein